MTKRTRGIPARDADSFDTTPLQGRSSFVGPAGVEPAITLGTFIVAIAVLAFVLVLTSYVGT